jgi:hypothetical protein
MRRMTFNLILAFDWALEFTQPLTGISSRDRNKKGVSEK